MTTNKSYFYALGKRKTARATIRLYPNGKGDVTVNGSTLREWADDNSLQFAVMQPIDLVGMKKDVDLEIKTSGGGKKAQADAIQLGVSRALVKQNNELRSQLKTQGFLTRDSRVKERKKPGLKRARRAPQWAKR